MDYYFRLYMKVYVSRDETYNDVALVKRSDINDDSLSSSFVNVGFLSDTQFIGPVSSFRSQQVSNSEYIESLISYSDLEHNGVMFTYSRGLGNNQFNSKLWCVGEQFKYNEETHETTAVLSDINDNITGKIVFQTNTSVPFETNVQVAPFHFTSDTYYHYICFNSDRNEAESARGLKNGGNWYCNLYIIDPDSPLLNTVIDIKTLELPSVYKPFYMRGAVIINNDTLVTNFFGNVFNGIGYYNNNNNNNNNNTYEVGTFKCSINEFPLTKKITRSKPTLLCNYDESIDSVSLLYSGTSENISVECEMIEHEPGNNTIPTEIFTLDNIHVEENVSFYKINYSYSANTHDQNTSVYQTMIIDSNFYDGTTSEKVRYFFVSEFFYKLFNSSTPICNKHQKYEINPQSVEYNDDNKQFLSLYGVKYFEKYADYANQLTEELLNSVDKPDKEPYVIEIDSETLSSVIALHESGKDYIEFFDHYLLDGSDTSVLHPWHVIGMTDPLIDLLVRDRNLFLQEITYGNVLPPNENFLSVITYYKDKVCNRFY